MNLKFLSFYTTFTDIVWDKHQREQRMLLLMGLGFRIAYPALRNFHEAQPIERCISTTRDLRRVYLGNLKTSSDGSSISSPSKRLFLARGAV